MIASRQAIVLRRIALFSIGMAVLAMAVASLYPDAGEWAAAGAVAGAFAFSAFATRRASARHKQHEARYTRVASEPREPAGLAP